VVPLRPLSLLARGRTRPHPLGGQLPVQAANAKASPEPKPAPASEVESAAAAEGAVPGPQRDRATRAFLITMTAMVAVNFGALLGTFGWATLQALGWVAAPAIESAQREQAARIAQLDAGVQVANAAVAGLSTRVETAAEREATTSRRVAEIDGTLDQLRAGIGEVRAAQAAAEESWREPLAELTATATRTHGEIVGLRASLDELSRASRPEIINARIDRIEKAMVDRGAVGSIRGAIREKGSSREAPVPPDTVPDGHIINLPPAR
jgi:hypothetical protein